MKGKQIWGFKLDESCATLKVLWSFSFYYQQRSETKQSASKGREEGDHRQENMDVNNAAFELLVHLAEQPMKVIPLTDATVLT